MTAPNATGLRHETRRELLRSMVGMQLDNYRVVEKIGDGGMGSVYRAIDVMLERDVALKFLRPELTSQRDLVDRFRSEAVVLARLRHPNIAAIYGLHRHEDDLFMAMEFVPGTTLDARLARDGSLPPERAAGVAMAVLAALDYAHRQGVVHRDIKSANIIVTPDGDVKVMDFGIARVLGGQRHTRVGHVVGTLSYMSPEQIQGVDVDARSDLYALGVVLYEMLSGHPPFQADTEWKLMQAQISQPPAALRPVTDVTAELEAVVLRALEKSPEERFQSATEFRLALRASIPPDSRGPLDGFPLAPAADDPGTARSRATPPPFIGADAATMLHTAPVVSTPTTSHEPASPPAKPAAAVTARANRRPLAPKILSALRARWIGIAGASTAVAIVAALGVLWISGRAPWSTGRGAQDLAETVEPPLPPPFVAGVPAGRALPAIPEPTTDEIAHLLRLQPAPAPAAAPTSGRSAGQDGALQAQPTGVAPVVRAPTVVVPDVPILAATSPVATPAAPVAPFQRFGRVKLARQDGGNTRESDVILQLEGSRFVVFAQDGRTPVKTVEYRSVADASYSRASGSGVLFFGRGTRHYFTVHAGGEAVVLRLDGSNQERILGEFERLSGKAVRIEAGSDDR